MGRGHSLTVLTGQLADIEGADPRAIDACAQCFGIRLGLPDHFLRGFERTISVGLASMAKRVDGELSLNGRHYVLYKRGSGAWAGHCPSRRRERWRRLPIVPLPVTCSSVMWTPPDRMCSEQHRQHRRH